MIREFFKNNPEPDFNRILNAITGEELPDRVPFYELLNDIEFEIMESIGKSLKKTPEGSTIAEQEDIWLRNHAEYMYTMGYDYMTVGRNWDFEKMENPEAETQQGQRTYVTSQTHIISGREDFERYQWPEISGLDFSRFQRAEDIIPEGMKVIAVCAGILENVMLLLGHEGISYMLYDDPEMVDETFKKVGDIIIEYYDKVASFDIVGALSLSDDMGFKTHTMLSPDTYRKYLFPLYKKLVETIHSHGKVAIFHSCGQLSDVMEDIIDCGWDAKHSYEDTITPIWEIKEKYGDRISVLGGFDMHKIVTMSPEEVEEHTKFLISKCDGNGRWALGTGNSVANYVPVENFIAMLKAGAVNG